MILCYKCKKKYHSQTYNMCYQCSKRKRTPYNGLKIYVNYSHLYCSQIFVLNNEDVEYLVDNYEISTSFLLCLKCESYPCEIILKNT